MPDKCENRNASLERTLRRIGLFLPTGWEYCDRLVEGILRYQSDHGGVVVREFRYDADEPEDRENWARRARPWESWMPHGLVVNISADPGLPQWVGGGGEPVINTGGSVKMRCVCLSSDGFASKAIEHFKASGYTHFAFVSQLADAPLYRAYQSRLKKIGIGPSHHRVALNPSRWDVFSEEQVASTADLCEMLRQSPKPLAVLCENDDLGRIVCLAALRMGLEIPREVGVLGVNNLASSRTCVPPLSSIHAPGDQVGYRAMELMVKLIDGQDVPQRVELPPGKVIVRQSTALGSSGEIDMLRVVQVIRDRACEGISLEDLLPELQISESTLRREFIRIVGCPPGEEMARMRLERAKELLHIANLPIEHVATATGYTTRNNFTAFFRNQTGLSPRDYRKRHAQAAGLRAG